MQVVHIGSAYLHYNNNLKFCFTYFDVAIEGYTQHSLAWWLDVLFIGMITSGYIIYGYSDEILGVM